MTPDELSELIKTAGIQKKIASEKYLGSGESNDTYGVAFDDNDSVVVRISRRVGRTSLTREAPALKALNVLRIPKVLFFDPEKSFRGRLWVVESFVSGATPRRLTIPQLYNLGKLLAQVHKTKSKQKAINLKKLFLLASRSFGDEAYLLNHPHQKLRKVIKNQLKIINEKQPIFDKITPSLIHADVTPNVLVDGDEVGLIDWEFAKYNDPMADFATVFYEDISYHNDKWRIKISPDEKAALFDGYRQAGGEIDENRLRFWIRFDKVCALIFLYWKLNIFDENIELDERAILREDFENLLDSVID